MPGEYENEMAVLESSSDSDDKYDRFDPARVLNDEPIEDESFKSPRLQRDAKNSIRSVLRRNYGSVSANISPMTLKEERISWKDE